MTESIDEIFMLAQIEVNDLLRRSPTKADVLKDIFHNYRRNIYYERKVELLKQYCLENGITGLALDVELYNSSSASFVFNDADIEKELEEAKIKVKNLIINLKNSSNTKKDNKKTICIGKSKEVRNNINKVK